MTFEYLTHDGETSTLFKFSAKKFDSDCSSLKHEVVISISYKA